MKLGVLVHDLGPSQLAYYLIRNANAALADGKLDDVIVFYEQLARPCLQPHFAVMQAAEAWGFGGTLLATSLATSLQALRCPAAEKRIFYVWDLEWLRLKQKSFRELAALYGNPQLHLLARSQEHADLLARCWNRSCAVVRDFAIDELLHWARPT